MAERNRDNLYPLILFLILFLTLLLRNGDILWEHKLLIDGDSNGSFYAWNYIRRSILGDGEVPFWNRFLSNGTPFVGSGVSVFDISSILGLFVEPQKAWFLTYVFFVSVGAVFVYLYLRRLFCNKSIATLFSVLYCFSIHLGGTRCAHIGIIISTALFPVILYCMDIYLEKDKRYMLLIAAVLMSVQFHSGFMQTCLYSDIALFIYFVLKTNKSNWKKRVRDCIIWIGVYFFLIAGYLLPIIQMMRRYSQGGSRSSDMNYFITGSLHPIKLLMGFIPDLWGNVSVPLNEKGFGSSGLDIELFLGTLIMMIAILGGIKFRRDKNVKSFLIIGLMALLFAINYVFPFLTKILYKVPLLNMFRMPSRTLFIYFFSIYVIAALTLQKIFETNQYLLLVKGGAFFGFIILLLVMIQKISGIQVLYVSNLWEKSWRTLFLVLGFAFLVYATYKKVYAGKKELIVCIFIGIVTLLQTYPYNYVKSGTEKRDQLQPIEEAILSDLGNGQILQLSTNDYSYIHSLVNGNRGEYTLIPQLNAALSFNNPALFHFMNISGNAINLNESNGLSSFKDSKELVVMQNDVLSMLGVRFLSDSEQLFAGSNTIVSYGTGTKAKRLVMNIDQIQTKIQEPAVIYAEEIDLQKDMYYIVSFNYECEDWDNSVYFDFYGDCYDLKEQDIFLNVNDNEGKNVLCVFSGDVPEEVPIYFRVISNGSTEILLSDIKIMELEGGSEVYKKVFEGKYYSDNVVLYKNENARDILYVPEEVKYVENIDIVYDLAEREPLHLTSYIEKGESFLPGEANISGIQWKNNEIRTEISAKSDSFLNFSQNYSKDWKAYIDGVEVENLKVNNLIQGIYIPAGNHVIEFKYKPVFLYASIALNVFAYIMVCLYCIFNIRRNKLQNNK